MDRMYLRKTLLANLVKAQTETSCDLLEIVDALEMEFAPKSGTRRVLPGAVVTLFLVFVAVQATVGMLLWHSGWAHGFDSAKVAYEKP